MTDASAEYVGTDQEEDGMQESADLIALVRSLSGDEAAKEAELILMERPDGWHETTLAIEAERRYIHKNFGDLAIFGKQTDMASIPQR